MQRRFWDEDQEFSFDSSKASILQLNSGQNEGETYFRLNIDLEYECQAVGRACVSGKQLGEFVPVAASLKPRSQDWAPSSLTASAGSLL